MKSFLRWLLLWLPLLGHAQTPWQVVSKVIEKSLPYEEDQFIQINAQKADVILKGWNRPTVSVKLRLVAKHPDRAVAEREVAYHQYILQTKSGQIDLSNRFVIPQRAEKLQSQLKAIYEVSLPAKALIMLTNSFGDIQLSNLSGTINLKFEFGKSILNNIGGKLAITSTYGDVDGSNLDATLILKAEKADVTLQDLSGTSDLHSHYGKLTILPATSLNSLNIEAARTEILIATKRLADFRFDVVASYAEVSVPEHLINQRSKARNKQTFTYQASEQRPVIRIQNSYSTTTIQAEKSLVTK